MLCNTNTAVAATYFTMFARSPDSGDYITISLYSCRYCFQFQCSGRPAPRDVSIRRNSKPQCENTSSYLDILHTEKSLFLFVATSYHPKNIMKELVKCATTNSVAEVGDKIARGRSGRMGRAGGRGRPLRGAVVPGAAGFFRVTQFGRDGRR